MRTTPERPLSVRQVTVVGVVAFSLFTLLNASSLLRLAERQPFGWQRTAAVTVAGWIDDVSGFAYLDRPRLTVDDALGRTHGDAGAFTDLEGAPATHPDATADPPPLRSPSSADPLRLWIVGDSQAEILGQSVIDRAQATGLVEATLDFEFSSGLTRPDFFNWPGRITDIVERERPDAMVVAFGANDSQGMQVPSGVAQPGDRDWNAEYARRVDAVMGYLEAQGVRVYWLGQPIARDPSYSARLQNTNEIFRRVAEGHANTTYVSLYDLFADESGAYADYLRSESGQLVEMRNPDGVHLTADGGDRAADVIFGTIEEDLPPPDEGRPGDQPGRS